jgi:uncharacterized protein (DUF1800 family)
MQPLSFSEARHLVARTGLGAEWGNIRALTGKSLEDAVNTILNKPTSSPRSPPAMSAWHVLEPMRQMDAQHRTHAWMVAQQEGKQLQHWWVEQILATHNAFEERMVLFWHNHFTSSIQKTLQPNLLHKQNLLFRRYATGGNYAELLLAIAKDPAMLVYLDGYQNTQAHPNENFARELLELFTLGRGHYSEADIKAAARAFTGWGVDEHSGTFVDRKAEHDSGQKTFLGQSGNFAGEDIIQILLKHPRTAETVCEKLWREFINQGTPSAAVVKTWAQQWRTANYDLSVLLKAVFTSDAFWAEANRGTLVKSPVDILLGTVRMLPYPRESTTELVNLLRLLGQELFDPPSVRGWRGGDYWISTQTLLVRTSYLTKISRGNLNQRVDTGLKLPQASNEQLTEWMLAVEPLQAMPDIPGDRRLVRALLLDPAFQVL